MPRLNLDDYFTIDPFAHKRISLIEKLEYCRRYSSLISKQLGKSRVDIVASSNSFSGRPKDLLQFFSAMSFWQVVRKRELTKKATTLAILSAVITAEGLMLRSSGNDQKRFIEFLSRCFGEEDKKLFLKSFIFSRKQNFPVGQSKIRHMVYKKVIRIRPYARSRYCHADSQGSVGCECLGYIDNLNGHELNKYFRRLASKIYAMRCSIVHDALAVSYCHTEENPDNHGSWSYGVIDSFQLTRGGIIQYETTISRRQIENAFKQAFWEAFKFGWPK